MGRKLVVGLRGLTRGNIHWGSFPDVLKRVAPDIHFLTLEMAGNGSRADEISDSRPEKVIEDFRHQLQKWKKGHPEFASSKLNVLGISLGGMLSLKWAELYPEEIDQLFVVNSSLKQLSSFNQRLIPKNYFGIIKVLSFGSVEKQEQLILSLTSNNLAKTSSYLPSYILRGEEKPFRLLNFFRQIILASRIKIEKPLLSKPIFFVSQNDRLVNSSCSHDLKKKFEGYIYENSLAGHDLSLDQPDWLAQKIKEFHK